MRLRAQRPHSVYGLWLTGLRRGRAGSHPSTRKTQDGAYRGLDHPVGNRQQIVLRRGEVVSRYVGEPGHYPYAYGHESEQANENPASGNIPAAHPNAVALGTFAVSVASVPPPGWRRQESQHAGQ